MNPYIKGASEADGDNVNKWSVQTKLLIAIIIRRQRSRHASEGNVLCASQKGRGKEERKRYLRVLAPNQCFNLSRVWLLFRWKFWEACHNKSRPFGPSVKLSDGSELPGWPQHYLWRGCSAHAPLYSICLRGKGSSILLSTVWLYVLHRDRRHYKFPGSVSPIKGLGFVDGGLNTWRKRSPSTWPPNIWFFVLNLTSEIRTRTSTALWRIPSPLQGTRDSNFKYQTIRTSTPVYSIQNLLFQSADDLMKIAQVRGNSRSSNNANCTTCVRLPQCLWCPCQV